MPDANAASVLAFVATGVGGIEGSVTARKPSPRPEDRDMLAGGGHNRRPIQPIGDFPDRARLIIITRSGPPTPRFSWRGRRYR